MLVNDAINEIIDKYYMLIYNYNNFFFNNIKIYKDIPYLENVFIKGLKLIENIFNISILYVDNLVEIYNLCEKGYVYFIEFMNQININTIEESSFDLTIKDAIIFCYKKTIFLLDNKIAVSPSAECTNKNNVINMYNELSQIINRLFIKYNSYIFSEHYISDELFPQNTKLTKQLSKYNILIHELYKNISTLLNLSNVSSDNPDIIKYLKNINTTIVFSDYLKESNYKMFLEKYINKKLYIKNINFQLVLHKLNIDTLDTISNINSVINYLIC
jgi:hypothetical protein